MLRFSSMQDEATLPARSLEPLDERRKVALGLVILWCHDEPDRVGQVLFVPPGQRWSLGRGMASGARLQPASHRPGAMQAAGPLASARVSRHQLDVRVIGGMIEVKNVGRCSLRHDGVPVTRARVAVGQTLELHNELLLMVVSRAADMEGPQPRHAFGKADEYGIVGESPQAYSLRAQIAFLGPRSAHVLVHGDSGTGKELVARALHRVSTRSDGPLVSRNAATIPHGIADAELFGNARNFPNPGMAERPGLIGAAHTGSLFLDEFAELPEAQQASLLRVMDQGEYHRLGDSQTRVADFRLIAATNRSIRAIKPDVLARMPLRIEVPALRERREDVPLIVAHLLRQMASDDPDIAERWFVDGRPRTRPSLIRHLVELDYDTNVRQVQRILWAAVQESSGEYLCTPTVDSDAPDGQPSFTNPASLTAEVITAALERNGWRQTETSNELGLSSRHVLKRLMRKHGLRAQRA